ncbi:radical SAM protein [Paenibacillus maysiensis]|uniref:radical SAM protein n=1 Tax=Paenibacillus maysiensis TaxID=1155954 RepID=UPI0004B8E05C|nr:radical SAM protein [Paenibacillus maysiensis]
MPTYKCTASCEHCGTLSHPRETTWLPIEQMLKAIDEAADLGYNVVVFTGGEATLAGQNLLKGIERASSHGITVRIVSNAHWATNDRMAERRIGEFVRAGLTEINLSTGDQHARFVPLDNVIRAARAAVKAGLRAMIMVETVLERIITKEVVENHPEFQDICNQFPSSKINILESPWMPLSPSTLNKYPDGVTVNRSNLALCKGCDSILTTTTIQADGQIAACCGLGMRKIPELKLDSIRETKLATADQTAGEDFLKRWLRVEGPERILAWASDHKSNIEWENMYAHRCQACMRIYTDPEVREVIAKHHKEKIADVLLSEWLMFHYNPLAQVN